MSRMSEIDRQMAELEAMASGGSVPADRSDVVEKKSASGSDDDSRFPLWIKIVGIAALVDIAARFFVPSSQSFVLVLEAGIFLVAATALLLPVVRRKPLSRLRRRIHAGLGAVFALGAIRSGLWGLGVAVELANLTIFLLGLAALGVWFFVRRRSKAAD